MSALDAAEDERWVRRLVTPEGVDLRVRLADAGQRAGAFLLDALIMIAATVVLTLAAGAAAVGAGLANRGQVAIIVWLLGFFVIRNAYFIVFELTPRAATPGKRAVGVRVAARDGGRLTVNAVIARNAMREIEVFVPLVVIFSGGSPEKVDGWLYLLSFAWVSIFVFFPLFNRDRLRVGDLVAGTWVVRAPRRMIETDMAAAAASAAPKFDFTPDQAGAYGIKELHVLEDVLRRRDRKTMIAVADRIRRKIGRPRGEAEADDEFLEAYYAELRRRLEAGLLFGRRRADKHDKG